MSSTHKIPSISSKAIALHKKGITGKNVTIAILDSGLAKHPDIAPNRILAFRDFIQLSDEPYDDYNHGTHVTGIVASSRIGIAPECNIIALKILDSKGQGSTDIFIEAIKWILYHQHVYNIQIVNISIGGNTTELKRVKNRLNLWVNRMWENGIIVCCSAGNNGPTPNSISAPGNCKKVITVGACDGKHFSSAGPLSPSVMKPEISAPGYHILSLKPNIGYSIKNGTSMSVPFISGACALLLQKHPTLTNEQIKYYLIKSANSVPGIPRNIQGAGMVNLEKLLSLPSQYSSRTIIS
ncbi:MAG: S8 family peptidase [Lachnospiraceae bacterium]|nr:S8 family peptidase [Lachnospiraceae bacterium]